MNQKLPVRVYAAFFVIIAASVPAIAQQPPPGITIRPLVAGKTTITGQPLAFPLFRNQVTALLIEIAPGGRSPHVMFQVPTVSYMLEGTVTVEIQGQPARTQSAGEAFIRPINTPIVGVNRGTRPARFLHVAFGDARKPDIVPVQGAPGAVGFRATPVLQTTKTWTGEEIVFPLLANQFLVLIAEFAPGAVNPRHVHPHTQFAYVLEGSASVEADGLPPRVFGPGQTFVETLIPHVGANRTNAGGRLFTIFVGEAGTPPTAPPPR